MLPGRSGSLQETLRHEAEDLCLGAHSDDITIGCGGTILKMLSDLPAVEVYW